MTIHRSSSIKFAARLIMTALIVSSSYLPVRLAASSPAHGVAVSTKPYSRKASSDALKWADKELKRMSLDEKIGQLVAVGLNATYLNQDSAAFKDLRHQIVDNHVGGIVLFRGPVYESVMLVN